tara:strand:+ start:1658 stop:1969 length:312 start_codon:yes stop_codon:yes gene_type:complete
MKKEYREPNKKELDNAKEARQKVERNLDNFFYVLCEEQGQDPFELALALLIYAQEEIFQQEDLHKAYFLINQTAMAVYLNEQNLSKKNDLIIGENVVVTKEVH